MTEVNSPTALDGQQLSAVRQKRLLEIVRAKSAMSVRDLCQYLQVSDATVRRDVNSLEKKGLLSRTHGGVVANSIVNFDLPESARAKLNEDEKNRIGLAAIESLQGNETVMIDAGTTAIPLAMNARLKPDCTFVTTSLGVSQILKEQSVKQHYLIGGCYLALNDSFCGSIAISTIRKLSFDVAFLCASAVDVQRRAISMGSDIYAQVQKEIISVSRQNIVIVDSSKFKSSAFTQTASFDAIDVVITDRQIEEHTLLAFEKEHVEMRLV